MIDGFKRKIPLAEFYRKEFVYKTFIDYLIEAVRGRDQISGQELLYQLHCQWNNSDELRCNSTC